MKKFAYKTQARELSLQFLYQLDLRGQEIYYTLDKFLQETSDNKDAINYAIEIIQGYLKNKEEINNIIKNTATNWSIHRMAKIDRAILQIATYELLYLNLHKNIVINEAVELGKRYSTENSGSFINGILDTIWRKHKPQKTNET